jgi:Uncharacterised nucleotidyltransferase
MNFAGVLKRIGERLEREGQPFALVGGLGLATFGITRATMDLDLLVSARAQDAVVALMEELGYETLHRSSGYSNHQHPDEAFGRVDFIYVRGDTERKIFAGASRREGPDGGEVLVPRPEHLVAMKVVAMKNDPARRLQDLADIAKLLALEGIDRSEVRATFERHGMLGSWDELERDRPD